MKNFLMFGVAAMALGACSGSSITTYGPGGSVGGDGDSPIGGEDTCTNTSFTCAGDVVAVTYDADSDTLVITGTPFDETPLAGTYIRADLIDNSTIPDYDFDYASDNVNGFAAYENDDDFAINPFLAINQTSDDGSITVGQVAVAQGYRTFGYGGYWIRVNESGTVPTTQLARYDGSYAGIVAFSGEAAGSGDIFTSGGDVAFDVDFTDGVVKGIAFNRTINGDAAASIIFDDTPFTASDTYAGNATSVGLENNWGGTYAGVFTGSGGATTGGVFVVEQTDFFDNEDDPVTARETGVFIAEKTSP